MQADRPGVRRIGVDFEDARGTISDILDGEPINSVTIITSRAGAVRGNHYHKESRQFVYVIEGSMIYTMQRPGSEAMSFVVQPGDLVVSEPNERHAMRAVEHTVFIALTHGPRAGRGFESDTYRLDAADALDPPE